MSEAQTKKPTTPAVYTKLLLLVAIVFALTKWGLPFMNNMVAEFREAQEGEQEVINPDKKLTSTENDYLENAELSDEEKLQLAIEDEINHWIKKRSPESSATVKFINANQDGSKLAVEYLEKNTAGETESKELILTRDEFGIYIYEDAEGVRQIRIRQPE
jgi:hypothetical protein